MRESTSLGINFDAINDLSDGICAIANKRSIFYLWRPIANDPDDDFLIDIAMEAQADFIITYNQKDLQEAESFGIMVVTPKQFLQRVGEIK